MKEIHWAIDAILATGLLSTLALALRDRLNARLQQARARLAAEKNPVIGRAIDSLLCVADALADGLVDEAEARRIAAAVEAAVRESLNGRGRALRDREAPKEGP